MMLPSQRIELQVYRTIKQLEPGRVCMTVPRLSQETGEDHAVIQERLEGLFAEGHLALFKYSGGAQWPYAEFRDKSAFFHTTDFYIEVTPQGRKYFEQLEQLGKMEDRKPLVFISCGQFSPKEVSIGKQLATAVNTLTSCEGYFAENQNSFENLSSHIFKALDQCAGFVAVMHHRGEVGTPSGQHIRGSVWIEQEISIAAFLTAIHKREIPVALYVQKGIKREGVREQLRLNPIEFNEEAEVLANFESQLKNGTFKPLTTGTHRNAERLRERGEELYSLINEWLNRMAASWMRRNMVMQGKLTYNQAFDLDIAEGKAPFDFSRIELLIDTDFPFLRTLYDQIISERTKLNRIEVAFKRSCEQGEHDGEEFLPRYLASQNSVDGLGAALQKKITEHLRELKV